ncbi:MAG: thioredoxin family protein [Prevotella sp.]|nr:thioredoxin family protein [Prevotella sp.]
MRRKRLFWLTLCMFFVVEVVSAQTQPVHFSVQQKQISPTEVEVVFSGKIDKGWHVYSTDLPSDGPISASLTIEKADGAAPIGTLRHQGNELNQFDSNFGMKLRYFENAVTFIQRFKLTGGTYRLKGYLEYGACNDQMCMPPEEVPFNVAGKGPDQAQKTENLILEEKIEKEEQKDSQQQTVLKTDSVVADSARQDTLVLSFGNDLWQPVVDELKAQDTGSPASNYTLLYIFFMGFVGGLLALCTPCVWPIIPMTVSFFLKRSKDKTKGLRDAVGYGLSIVAIFLLLGLLVSLLGRADWLNDLATNAVFNIFLCLLLVVFALSFFGWFEISLPSKWADAVDTKATNTRGWLSIFLMALTLVLVSFSCTAPIVGLLLVETVTAGDKLGPLLGMTGFALALALPFTLFALFPTWLKQVPKSGSWMNIIKVVLGFIELAFACKFFSVADLAYGWRLMDREVFLALWISIFLLLGLYLVGVYRFRSDGDEVKAMPVPCIMLGLVSIAFALYMLPGLWGAPCKAVSAFAPPMYTQDFNLNPKKVEAAYTDYDEGMAAAKAQGKPVLIDFTGFGCVNCRKMEASVWTDPAVADKLMNDYVLISLYVDDKKPLSEPFEITEKDGRKTLLRTVGDKWKYLERHKFGYLAQPFYVAIDNDGRPLNGSFVYQESVAAYLEFLNQGLENYRK